MKKILNLLDEVYGVNYSSIEIFKDGSGIIYSELSYPTFDFKNIKELKKYLKKQL